MGRGRRGDGEGREGGTLWRRWNKGGVKHWKGWNNEGVELGRGRGGTGEGWKRGGSGTGEWGGVEQGRGGKRGGVEQRKGEQVKDGTSERWNRRGGKGGTGEGRDMGRGRNRGWGGSGEAKPNCSCLAQLSSTNASLLFVVGPRCQHDARRGESPCLASIGEAREAARAAREQQVEKGWEVSRRRLAEAEVARAA